MAPMKRLGRFGGWWRVGVQAGLLLGMGLTFVGGPQPAPVGAAPPGCVQDEMLCTFRRPMLLIDLDYSTSMNTPYAMDATRWEVVVGAVKGMIAGDNGFAASYFMLGLLRFGHDPDPMTPGTKIVGDASGIVDGQKLDVGFYDEVSKAWYACDAGEMIGAALTDGPAPLGGNLVGIGTWTKGSLDFAADHIAAAKADHPEDLGQRRAAILVITDGEWTNPQGTMKLMPASESPAITAASLYEDQGIPTHVVAMGDAMGKMFADQLAAAGGTGAAVDVIDAASLYEALRGVVSDVADQQIVPACGRGRPRVMVLLDASSSMLNIQAGLLRAKLGQGGWEMARDALAGSDSIFDLQVGSAKLEDLVDLGLAVFGASMPDEAATLVQYGPCLKTNFAWALDPASSCVAPGCVDPYADAPITWTFQDGSQVLPLFAEPTLSHMPRCDQGPLPNKGCFGSGTYTHLGLVHVQDNLAAYKAACMQPDAEEPCDADTRFVNILITDGQYNSTDPQVTAPLLQMYDAGVTTRVIGFGDGVDSMQAIAKLNTMAHAGSGGLLDYYDANNQAALEAALADILGAIPFDPCCAPNDCAPEFPDTFGDDEPDPLPPIDSTGTTGDTTGDTSGTTAGVDSDTSGTTTGAAVTTGDATTGAAGTTSSGGIDPDTGTAGAPTSSAGEAPTGASDGDTSGSGEGSSGTTSGGEAGGCGCRHAGDGPAGSLLALAVAGLLRRRRR